MKCYNDLPPYQKHSTTSIDAAFLIKDKTLTLRAKVLRYIEISGGATDEELQFALDMNPNTERPRRRELQLKGNIIDSGQTRKTRSGRKAVVWKAEAQGRLF